MSFPTIYLDANSTTPLDRHVSESMLKVADEAFGNPGSSHQVGRKARQILERSRETVAEILGGTSGELIFTSGATESTNLALGGLAAGIETTKPTAAKVIAATGGEHPATSQMIARLEQQGWRYVAIPLDGNGVIDATSLKALPWEEIDLVSVIYANNETGVLQDLADVADLCQTHQIPWHVDFVQAVGRIPISFNQWGATAGSFCVHKCHGPRGIGGLFLRSGVPFVPAMVGGFQEMSRRPGTEPVMLAAGMAETLRVWQAGRRHHEIHLQQLRDQFETALTHSNSQLVINGSAAPRLPNTSNITFPGVEGEAFLIALDLAGICCSLGSACASGSVEPSPVLLAMGIDPIAAKSSVRFSLNRNLTSDDVATASLRISRVLSQLT